MNGVALFAPLSGTAKRMESSSSVFYGGALKQVKRFWLVQWEYPEGAPAVQHILLMEDWTAPEVAPSSHAAVANNGAAHTTWSQVTDSNDVRYPYSVVVNWFDASNNDWLAEDFASQVSAQTSPRTFGVLIESVYAKLNYQNAYGSGPQVTTNTVYVGGT
jgi:hypothetical protein